MGRIFKTPGDDAVEGMARAMHNQNVLDTTYEKGVGWLKVALFSGIAAFIISAFEFYTDWNLWESTADWFKDWASRQLGKLV